MTGAILLVVWYNLSTQTSILNSVNEKNGRLLAETIRNSIHTNMKHAENSEVREIIEKIGADPSIESVKIFDESGRILISDNRYEIGDLVEPSDLLSYRAGLSFVNEQQNSTDHFKFLLPIENKAECFGCHSSDQRVLGILSLHTSIKGIDSLYDKGRDATIFSSIGALAVLIIVITLFILVYVDTPIRKLAIAMNRVEKGDFEHATVEIESSDEMSELADKFNNMVTQLKSLLDRTIQHECELAIHREKLSHHDEIQSMNMTLEERLKEIEYLNISLEERIEEIEEANYKIADLASDLEIKNTSLESTVVRLAALNKMGMSLNSTHDLDKLFDILIRKAIEALGAKLGYILLLDSDSWALRTGHAIGMPSSFNRNAKIPLRPGGVSFWVIENRMPLLIEDHESCRDFNKHSTLGYTRETTICAPLMVKDEIIGTITIANKHDKTSFNGNDLELLNTIAAQASIAIKNVRLYEEQQSTYLSTVQALISAVEASDAYTRGHSERVTRYSLAIGRHLGLGSDALKRLEHAAVLHDVGKIGIDLSLLHKEGQLSSNDVQTLQQHPLIGSRILEPITFLNGVRDIIVQHHERYDGCGYPFRIKGDEIFFEARILSVADTYDAMTSDRPYRKALSHDIAIEEIRKHSGTQFDPSISAAVCEMCTQGIWPTA